MDELWNVYRAVLDTENKGGQKFENLCYKTAKEPDDCVVSGVLQFWQNNYTQYQKSVDGSDAQLLKDVSASTFLNGQPVEYTSLGGLVVVRGGVCGHSRAW